MKLLINRIQTTFKMEQISKINFNHSRQNKGWQIQMIIIITKLLIKTKLKIFRNNFKLKIFSPSTQLIKKFVQQYKYKEISMVIKIAVK